MGVNTQFPAGEFEAVGVVYAKSEHAPGLRLFRCQPYKATISARSCAVRFRKAQDAVGSMAADLEHCKCCPIGSCHAGLGQTHFSPWYGVKICPRCNVGTTRMIGNRQCVSCYNRTRELKAGRNARGNRPVELMQRPLRAVEMIVEVDGVASRWIDRETQSLQETIRQTTRTTKGRLAFGFAGGPLPPVPAPASGGGAASEGEGQDGESAGGRVEPGPELWGLTDRRCGCGGLILQNATLRAGCRCADCGAASEMPEEPVPDVEPEREVAAAPARAPNPDRGRLLATSALVRPRWSAGRVSPPLAPVRGLRGG